MINKKMKVLITGGLGYIGKNFIKKYENVHELVVISKERDISIRPKESIHLEYGDVSGKKIIKIIEKLKPDVVIHLAALSGLKKCEENPEKAFEINVTGTANIVEGCLAANSRLVFISTREVYGITNKESNENDSLDPINTYGQTKMKAEKIVESAKDLGLNYAILRLSNVYGLDGITGINQIIKESIEKGTIFVNGGEQILNFIFIEDVIEVINLAIQNKRWSNEVFNIGTENSIKLKEFVEILIESINRDIEVKFREKPEYESPFFQPNIKKQQNTLGYNAKIGLKEGIMRTIQTMNHST